MEKPTGTETLELCVNKLANLTRRENFLRNHFRSKKMSVTQMEKPNVTEASQLCINQLANMRML